MNQELKNFDMLIIELESSYQKGDYGTSKTIVNIYSEMLPNLINNNLVNNYRFDNNLLFSKHLDILKSLVSKIINVETPKLIQQGDFKSLHNVQYTQEKIQGFINNIESILKQFEIKLIEPSYDVYNMLEMSIKNGILLTQTNESTRSIGKTTALIKKTFEHDCTLVVGKHMTKQFVNNCALEMGYKIDCQYINDLSKIQGRRMKNSKFLVDDTVSNQIIKELVKNKNEFLGGFNSLNDSLSTAKQPTLLEHLHTKLNKLLDERNVINATYMDEAPAMVQWIALNRKIEVINDLIDEESHMNKSTIKTLWKVEKDGTNVLKGKISFEG